MSRENRSEPSSDIPPEEVDIRREAGLKKLLATPHKPHNPKGKTKKAKPAERA